MVSTGPSTERASPCPTVPPYGLWGIEITPGGPERAPWYGEDLAYIHDVGHAEFALRSAPGILGILDQHGIRDGLVVDLGCGSGLLARKLIDAGYSAFGIDISGAMVKIARRRVPEAEFRIGSLFGVGIPPCVAVTAVSEVLNYLFDAENEERGPGRLFRRVHDALAPGGLFVFDVLSPGQEPPGDRKRSFRVGEDWAVLSELEEDAGRGTMERRIVSFRKVGSHYRRNEEVHRVRLYEPPQLFAALEKAGFLVRTMRSYGDFSLEEGHTAFVARKPV
jgi:SAM-dependent methyltransferase